MNWRKTWIVLAMVVTIPVLFVVGALLGGAAFARVVCGKECLLTKEYVAQLKIAVGVSGMSAAAAATWGWVRVWKR